MPDEIVDTPAEPVEGDPAPVEPTEVVEEEVVQSEPAYITTEVLQAELDRRDQSQKSWMGRRDKELTTHIGNVIDERLTKAAPQPSAEEVSTALLENPREVIRAEFEAMSREQNQQQQTHLTNTMNEIGNLMESDSLFKDKDLGNEVVEDIKKQVQQGKVNAGMAPEQSGKIMLGDALASVMRKRTATKVNPLADNTPGDSGGNLKPPAAAKAKAVKTAPLDERTKRMADHWGYKKEDLAKLFPAGEK